MCTVFAALERPRLSSREQHWIALVLPAAVQRSPWLRPATWDSPQNRTDKEETQTRPQDSQTENNKRIQKRKPSRTFFRPTPSWLPPGVVQHVQLHVAK